MTVESQFAEEAEDTKRFYRKVDFRRDKTGIPGKVTQIEYDPNRSAHIALITYLDRRKTLHLSAREFGSRSKKF